MIRVGSSTLSDSISTRCREDSGLFSMGEILGELSLSVAIRDGRDQVSIGFDLARQHVAHDFDEVVAGQQVCCFAVGQAFLGEEHQRNHHQRHVMMPCLPAPDLIACHAASALGILEGALDEMSCRLHVRQPTQVCLGLGIGQEQNFSFVPLISRRTSKCQQRARCSRPSQSHTRCLR